MNFSGLAFCAFWGGRHGLSVIAPACAPGWIATKLTKAVVEDPVRTEEIMGRLPAGRWGQPDDFEGPVIFLAPAASDYLSGAVIPVDGGYLTR